MNQTTKHNLSQTNAEDDQMFFLPMLILIVILFTVASFLPKIEPKQTECYSF